MRRLHTVLILAALSRLACLATPAAGQTLEPRWQKDFQKEVSWCVRTSPGILLVRSGKSLSALDAIDGRELWAFPELELDAFGGTPQEVPGYGILLLNRAKLPGDSQGKLIALNELTGERVWDRSPLEILLAVVPLAGNSDAVLVSTRLQKKALAAEAAAGAAAAHYLPMLPLALNEYPFHLQFQRVNLLTGAIAWSQEYPHLMKPALFSFAAMGGEFVLSVGNSFLATFSLNDGSNVRVEGSLPLISTAAPGPLLFANGNLVFTLKKLQAISAENNAAAWEITGMGKISGLLLANGVVAALGDSHIAAVDPDSGKELWRRETHGHTTNLLWDNRADRLVYVDAKGLHSIERASGKPLLDTPLHSDGHPELISFAGSSTVVAIGPLEVSAYELRTGKKLFSAGKPAAFFSSTAYFVGWGHPASGEAFNPWSIISSGPVSPPKGSLLTPPYLARVAGFAGSPAGATDAYETASDTGFKKAWWLDPASGQKQEVAIAGDQHDVSLALAMVFAVDGKTVWGAAIKSH